MIDQPTTADVLAAAEALIERAGITATAAGRYIAADPKLIFDLRKGRRLRPSTAQAFARRIAEHPAK